MQTFLPYPDFARSAECLDRLRLGKQRVEVLQILRALLVPGSGWANHPAVRMWRGYEGSLAMYGMTICLEWRRRGYADTCFDKIDAMFPGGFAAPSPPWIGDVDFHRSHQSNLLRKCPEHYVQFGWGVPADLPYAWPATARHAAQTA